jgi:hypothetical protein
MLWGSVIYCLYTNGSIVAAPTNEELDEVIEDMNSTGLDLTMEGFLENFIGVHIDTKEDVIYKLSQQGLIDTVIQEVFEEQPPSIFKDIPMVSSKVLSHHLKWEDHDETQFSMRRS